MLIDREKEISLQDYTNAIIGLINQSEQWIRWQAARVLIRWNALVIKGEDDLSPGVLNLKKKLNHFIT